MTTLLMILLLITALFLIVLVLIQRGRGGGLAGAFGGMGGQSAFGTKAGDLFTKVTVGVATVWILLAIVTFSYFSRSSLIEGGAGSSQPAQGGTADGAGAGGNAAGGNAAGGSTTDGGGGGGGGGGTSDSAQP